MLNPDQLINTGCMKGGVDDGDDDQYEEPLDPASTVDFNMKGMKGNFLFGNFMFILNFFLILCSHITK